MAKKQKKQEEPQQELDKVGLEHLSDEDLAWIATQRNRDDEMSNEAQIAFQELSDRTDRARGITRCS